MFYKNTQKYKCFLSVVFRGELIVEREFFLLLVALVALEAFAAAGAAGIVRELNPAIFARTAKDSGKHNVVRLDARGFGEQNEKSADLVARKPGQTLHIVHVPF